MELRLYPSLDVDFGRLYQISSNKQAHLLFSKAILNVGRVRTATVASQNIYTTGWVPNVICINFNFTLVIYFNFLNQ